AQILDLLRKLCKDKQVGMIIITHDMGVIAEITDRVAVLYRGKLVEEGATRQILGRPEHPYTKSLISAVPRSDIKLSRFPMVNYIEADTAHTRTESNNLTTAMEWISAQQNFEEQSENPLIQVQNLGMRFVLKDAFLERHRVTLDAVKDVNFSIGKGEVFGLVGESGSGKSTVARLIAGLYQTRSGSVSFNGT